MKLGLCFLLFLSLSINSLSSAEDAPLPTGRRLRVIVTEKFPAGNVFIGAAAHGASVQKQAGLQSALNREFSYVTPANDFKQSYILPNPESAWKWDLPEWWL
jgi:GH35 family endo-1,4-beta-xylanase